MKRKYEDFSDIEFDDNDVINQIILEQTLAERRMASGRRRVPLKKQWDWGDRDEDYDSEGDFEDDFDDDDEYADDYDEPDNNF